MAQMFHTINVDVRMLDIEKLETFCAIVQGIALKHPHLVPELMELMALATNPKTLRERRITWWTRLVLRMNWRRFQRAQRRGA